jgi:uncharacterized protein
VRIVIDTNVFINSIGRKSPLRWIFDGIINGEFLLCISNEIFYEYWEVLDRQTNTEIADNVANFLVTIPSVHFIEPYIKWNLITADADDNKFVDCCIAAGAECIITNDAHFNILNGISFPAVRAWSPEQFKINIDT